MPKKDSTIIYAMGRRVGRVENGVFHKPIKPNGYLKKPPAIAFDVQSLKEAEQAGASRVYVKDTQTGVVHKASIAHIWNAGFRFNRGFGDQIGLVLSAWIKQKPGGGIQLDMFEKVNPLRKQRVQVANQST